MAPKSNNQFTVVIEKPLPEAELKILLDRVSKP
jgi:hypothetical protein